MPAAAQTGAPTLITHTNLEVKTDKQAQIGAAAPNIAYYIFNDALNADRQKWGGWGTAVQDLEKPSQRKQPPNRAGNAGSNEPVRLTGQAAPAVRSRYSKLRVIGMVSNPRYSGKNQDRIRPGLFDHSGCVGAGADITHGLLT